jgi:hypothetical protein
MRRPMLKRIRGIGIALIMISFVAAAAAIVKPGHSRPTQSGNIVKPGH